MSHISLVHRLPHQNEVVKVREVVMVSEVVKVREPVNYRRLGWLTM